MFASRELDDSLRRRDVDRRRCLGRGRGRLDDSDIVDGDGIEGVSMAASPAECRRAIRRAGLPSRVWAAVARDVDTVDSDAGGGRSITGRAGNAQAQFSISGLAARAI